jgi:hypothetical protein
MAEFVSQTKVPSTTARTLERTAVIGPLDAPIRETITAYLNEEPEGTQATLRVLSSLGKAALMRLAKASGRTLSEIKQCVGMRVPILLVQMFGADEVATYRDPTTRKASTRSRSANWPDLSWVSRYTPHQVSAEGRKHLQSARNPPAEA